MYIKSKDGYCATGAEIAKFFALRLENIAKAKSVGDFCNLNVEWQHTLDVGYLTAACESLARVGVLFVVDLGSNILARRYACLNYDEVAASYGQYDYLLEGFGEVARKLGPSVLPIIVEKPSGDADLGSAFLLGNLNTIVTARHVVEDMRSVKVLGPNGSRVEIIDIHVSKDENIDIAMMTVRLESPGNVIPLKVSDSNLLDEVLCIGFPPIPGFDAVRVYDKAEINSYLRLSRGRVVSQASSYLDQQEFILFNARVKGGNSGGPILGVRGTVLGMLVQIPMSSQDSKKIDELGYGVAVPKKAIVEALAYPNEGRKLKLERISDYEYSTL